MRLLVRFGRSFVRNEERVLEETKEGRYRDSGVLAEGRREPPHAVHPIRGGIAPTTEPTQVFDMLLLFNIV
jgi:hypothetical protein